LLVVCYSRYVLIVLELTLWSYSRYVLIVLELTLWGCSILLLVQHQLFHLFPQVFMVDVTGVKGIAHKLRDPRAGGDLILLFLLLFNNIKKRIQTISYI
jgi:general stress protein CsbA